MRAEPTAGRGTRNPRVALLTYSTRPRGGVVHALRLAEELHRQGAAVHLFALGDPAVGFFRDLEAPHTIVPAPEPAPTLEGRVFGSLQTLTDALVSAFRDDYDIAHAEDCISARAALDARGTGGHPLVLRTVHHVDDFTTEVLVDCQRQSIVGPDRVLVVSEFWRRVLLDEFAVDALVVTNGVDVDRFRPIPGFDPGPLRARAGARGRFLYLTVGGIEPRKGSLELAEAMAKVKAALDPPPALAVVGGHSFQDYADYRERTLERAAALGLEMGVDIVLLGTVPDDELADWYRAADAFVFPSVKEGWGIAVMEALAAGLPVVAADIPVFREYITDGRDAILVSPGDAGALAAAMLRVAGDANLRARLGAAGPALAGRFTWEACAREHLALYREVLGSMSRPATR